MTPVIMDWFAILQMGALALFVLVFGVIPFCLVFFDNTQFPNDPY